MNCLACNQETKQTDQVECAACKGFYHYLCLNMTAAYFMGHNDQLKRTWCCPECTNITRRRNDNSPMRSQFSAKLNDTILSVDDLPENENKTTDNMHELVSSYCNKQKYATNQSSVANINDNITLETIGKLLDSKLKNNNQCMFIEMKNIIKTEIHDIMEKFRSEITQKVNLISQDHKKFETAIAQTDERIKTLEIENKKLQMELRDLEVRMTTQGKSKDEESLTNNNKKIVIYGFEELQHETDQELYERVNYVFYDLLGIHIDSYIEDLKRIGKRGYRRPLVIEVISKRVVKYVLQNAHCFRNSGITISAFMDTNSLKERKILRENLLKARRNGNHAIIRGNRLIINGQECTPVTNDNPSSALDGKPNIPEANPSTSYTESPYDIDAAANMTSNSNNIHSKLHTKGQTRTFRASK